MLPRKLLALIVKGLFLYLTTVFQWNVSPFACQRKLHEDILQAVPYPAKTGCNLRARLCGSPTLATR